MLRALMKASQTERRRLIWHRNIPYEVPVCNNNNNKGGGGGSSRGDLLLWRCVSMCQQ